MVAHHPPPEQAPDPRAWLAQFPAPRRSTIANWFHYAVRGGARTPAQVLDAVRATCARRLAWGENADAVMVLAALDTDEESAMVYAASVVAHESLPPDERQRVKAERTFAYLKDSMRGKNVTPAQVAYLQALGYRGAPPAGRAAASALIDQLKAGRG